MKSAILLAFITLATLLSSCGTKYVRMDPAHFGDHGYYEEPYNDSTWQVTFSGNLETSQSQAQTYALYRAAEFTSEKGYDYFVVTLQYSGTTRSTDETGHIKHDPATGRIIPDAVTNTLTICMFKGTCPTDNSKAHDAKATIAKLEKDIER